MKNIVRAFVVALAITGFAAATHVSAAQTKSDKVVVVKSSAFPIPMCPPDDPSGCQ